MCIPGRTNATHNRPEQAPRGRGAPRFPFCRGKEEGRAAAAGGIKGCGGRQHSCSFHVQKSVSRTSPSRFSEEGGGGRRGWSLNGTEQNSPFFWQWHQRRRLPLCLKWSMFEVFWRQWSGGASSLLPRSGDDYHLLLAPRLWGNCQRDMWITISPFSPADA